MLLGAHVSIAGGVANAVDNGLRIGCDVIQIFTKNQRQWAARAYTPAEIDDYRTRFARSGLKAAVAHDSYLINLASPDDALWAKSKAAFVDEAKRCDQLGVGDLVFHPGAHMGKGNAWGVKRIAEAVSEAVRATEHVRLDLECMAGHGSTIGDRLEDLAEILQLVGDERRTGICVDTCHIFAAGFDISTPEGYAQTMKAIDRTVGLRRVHAFHLNDSKGALNCRLDRHEDIGKGQIGRAGFALLMNDERFAHVPMNLETPGDDEGYKENLQVLRSLIGKKVPPARRTVGSFAREG